jgi:hypothetical protein
MFLSFNRQFRARPPVAFESLQVGSRTVPLLVVRNPRARRYLLRLRPDGAARVTIPRGGNRSDAQSFVERNRGWLEQQLEHLHTQPRLPVAWRVGTEILFRGELVRLEADAAGGVRVGAEILKLREAVIGAPGTASASFKNAPPLPGTPSTASASFRTGPQSPGTPASRYGSFPVGTEDVTADHATADLRPSIERHLRALAVVELAARVAELAAQHQFSVRRVTVRNQKSRWGSCSRRGTISLNWRLIQTPIQVRDYIILHELAHLRQMNHSDRFWQEVERLCPENSANYENSLRA